MLLFASAGRHSSGTAAAKAEESLLVEKLIRSGGHVGQEGGKFILKKYGREHFVRIRKKVKKESLSRSGKISGNKLKDKFGSDYFKQLGSKGGKKFSNKIKDDKELKKIYREAFITKMKTFTRKYPTKSGIKVRSKLEQNIADFLTENGVEFAYEDVMFSTNYGDYEPDFVIDNKLLEVFGMDTDFYFNKKIPKLKDFIENNKDKDLIIFTNIKNLPDKMKPILSHVIDDRNLLLKRLIGP